MRAFIFSLDAFIAFTLALIAIYSLIFFSSVPSSYYYLLTQTHYLSRDALLSLSTTSCNSDLYSICHEYSGSLLDRLSSYEGPARDSFIDLTIGQMIPDQFGYRVDISDSTGSFRSVYDTSAISTDSHAKSRKKISVSSQVVSFGNSMNSRATTNPFMYNSCGGGNSLEASRLLTCSDSLNFPPGSSSGPTDVIPSPQVRIVRLTVFI